MKKIILFIILFVFISYFPSQAEEISLSLDEAIAMALRDNCDILLKAEEVKKAKEKIAEGNASLFPSLSFTGSWTDTQGYYTKDLAQTTTQTTLKQYLYKGQKTINTIKYNGYNFEVAQAVLDKTKLETILNVKKAFYTLLLADEFEGLNKGILDNTEEHLDFFKARHAAGQASDLEMLTIESSLTSVKEAYAASLSQVESTQATLKNLLYLGEDIIIKPSGALRYESWEVAYDEAFLKAMKTRPEIRQYEAQTQANKKAIEITKADNRPNIYASWDYYSRSHTSLAAAKGWNDYNTIGLTFSWPIFDGWLTKAKVEQAIIDLKQTQLLKEKTIKDIILELKNAYLDLKNAIAKMRFAQSQIDLYKNNLSVIEDRYKAGIVSALDLHDASLSYKVSLFNHKEAIYDYIIAKARFDKATGG